MKVLHLTHVFPWPPDYGGRIAVWNHLRADARHARVGLVSFVETPPAAADLDVLRALCDVVHVVPRPRERDGFAGRVRALFSGHPVNLARYRWPVMLETSRRVAREWQPDLVIGQHLHMAPYAPEIPDVARVLRPHNVDSVLVARLAATAPRAAERVVYRALAAQTRRDEGCYAPRYDRVLLISGDDEREYRRIAPGARTGVLEAGIDLAEYRGAVLPAPGAGPLFATAGSLLFPPTALGVLDFVERAWPGIRLDWPAARLRIIGSCPEDLRARLDAQPGVEVTGRVESVAQSLDGVHGFLVALRAGSGVRIKILEAFARRLPVISTRVGAEGLGAVAGRDYLEADEPLEFRSAVRRLLTEPSLGPALREAGHAFVGSRSLEAMSRASERLYGEALVAAGRTPRKAPAS